MIRKPVLLGIVALFAVSMQAEQNRPNTQPATVALVNATVIDVSRGARQPGTTVVVRAGEIAAVGPRIPVPGDAVRFDASGKFLIPGLWDMHSHNEGIDAAGLGLYLANGVVGTRDMGSAADFIVPLRERIRRGEVRGPEIVAAGPILDNAPPHWPFRRTVRNADQAREAVRDLKKRGVDLIKTHNNTPRDAFFAIADEASKLGLPFAGHIPLSVTVPEGVASGIASIEHLSEFRVFRECAGKSQPYDAKRCAPLFDMIAARRIWQTPTVGFYSVLGDVFAGKPVAHAEYLTDKDIEMMKLNIAESKLDEKAFAFLRSMGQTSLTVIRDMLQRGNLFLAGCDGPVAGFCLHDELQALTTAGLSPLQALQTATVNPARYLRREETQGSIAARKRGDIVVLDADPLLDIRNTARIAAVVAGGRLISKKEIDRMIAARRRK